MFCEKCGKKVRKSTSFCSFCGEKINRYEKPSVKKKAHPFIAKIKNNLFLFIFPIMFLVWNFFGKLILQMFNVDASTVDELKNTIMWFVAIAFFGGLSFVASKKSFLFHLLYILPYYAVTVVLIVGAHKEYDQLFALISEACLPIALICAVVGVRTLFSKIKYEMFLDVLSLLITDMLYVMFSMGAITVVTRLSKNELWVLVRDRVLWLSLVFLFLCFVDYIVRTIKNRKNIKMEKMDEIL